MGSGAGGERHAAVTVKKFLEYLTMIVCALTLSLADETGWVASLAWIAASIGLVSLTVYVGGFTRGE